jgi:Holliday junction resolvase-like predicted endonuclease
VKPAVIIGKRAEDAAAAYTQAKGYRIVSRNWRTRYCEIDIVAVKGNCAHFIEVKYRAQGTQGQGLDYIAHKKLRQMEFAAELWVQTNGWAGDYTLGALEVSGQGFKVTAFLPDLDA